MLVRSSSTFIYLVVEYISLGNKPIIFKAAPVVAAVKKETPPVEDYSSWGQESATPTVNQEKICESSLYLLHSMNSSTCHPRETGSD